MAFENSWDDDVWRTEVEEWVSSELSQLGIEIVGGPAPIQQRPWSIVISFSTSEGEVYFKASCQALRHEAAFSDWLAKRFNTNLPAVLAVAPAAGWMLQRAAGQRMREAVRSEALVDSWERILTIYAQMQRQLVPAAKAILELGVPDRRPASLPSHLRRWRKRLAKVDQDKDSLTAAELSQLARIQPEVEQVCQALVELPPSSSINHGDLHDGNIAVADDGFRIFDWGDVSYSHPFFSLRSTFVSLENQLGWRQGNPGFQRLKRIYLAAWQEQDDLELLHRAFDLSSRVWSIGTALSWEAALASASDSARLEYAHVLPSLMRELLVSFGQDIDRPI